MLLVVSVALILFAERETKMPMLSWAEKSKVVNRHNDVMEFPLVKQDRNTCWISRFIQNTHLQNLGAL